MRLITLYLAALLSMLAGDAVWLTLAHPLYAAALGPLLAPDVNFGAAAGFYLIYAGGVAGFGASGARSVSQAGFRGAGLGLVAYGAYDLSNWATLKGWSGPLSLIDISWGVVLTALASAVAYAAGRRFFGGHGIKTDTRF